MAGLRDCTMESRTSLLGMGQETALPPQAHQPQGLQRGVLAECPQTMRHATHAYMDQSRLCQGIRVGHCLYFRPDQGVQQARANINIDDKHHASISSCHQSVHSHKALPDLLRDQSCEIRWSQRKEEKTTEKQKPELS